MKRHRRQSAIGGVFLAVALLPCLAHAEDAAQPPGHPGPASKAPPFDTFRIITERNIFDATRAPFGDASGDAAGPPPTQTLRLMGTWIEGERTVALFESGPDGSHETLGRGGTLAGYSVEAIRTDAVVLRNEQGAIGIRVGGGLAKEADGQWMAAETIDPPDRAGEQATEDTAPVSAPKRAVRDAPDEEGADSGAIRRLLKRLRKELGP
jgi:hypothetical protein